MQLQKLSLALVVGAALIAGCDKGPEQRADRNTPQARTDTSPQAQANTPTTPANIGQPASQGEKKDGANPVQGQVDPKHREQHKDFQQRGDGAGPRGPDTTPKPGG
jgi:hypothetical protein